VLQNQPLARRSVPSCAPVRSRMVVQGRICRDALQVELPLRPWLSGEGSVRRRRISNTPLTGPAAADELHRAGTLLDQAETRLSVAFNHSGQIAWHPDPAISQAGPAETIPQPWVRGRSLRVCSANHAGARASSRRPGNALPRGGPGAALDTTAGRVVKLLPPGRRVGSPRLPDTSAGSCCAPEGTQRT
jgi:hypothetical protein